MLKIQLALLFTIFVYSFASGATLIKSNIPTTAPFRQNETNWNFGRIAQGRTASSFFDVQNVSPLLPVVVVINTVKNFTVNPATFTISPNQTKRVTITLAQNAPIGSLSTPFFFQAKAPGQSQNVTSWAIFGDIVPAQPDLTGTLILTGPPQPSGANKFKISLKISVSNPANLVVSKLCEGQLFFDNNSVLTFSINPVNPGTTFETFQSFETNKTGAHVLKLKVDSNNANQELSETNNETPLNITIQ